jgi:hypothetical protein
MDLLTTGTQRNRARGRVLVALVILSVGAALIAGCGSSKPSYCSAVNNLENSIKALPSTDVVKNGTSALKSALTKVKDDANSVISAAKADFPSETSALSSSVNALSGTVTQLASSPSTSTAAQLPGQVAAVSTAAKNVKSATSSKCS